MRMRAACSFICFILCWHMAQNVIHSHFSQSDPCANSYNKWQADKVISDAKEEAYNQKKTEAAIALAALAVTAGAVATLEADRRELEGPERKAFIAGVAQQRP